MAVSGRVLSNEQQEPTLTDLISKVVFFFIVVIIKELGKCLLLILLDCSDGIVVLYIFKVRILR